MGFAALEHRKWTAAVQTYVTQRARITKAEAAHSEGARVAPRTAAERAERRVIRK